MFVLVGSIWFKNRPNSSYPRDFSVVEDFRFLAASTGIGVNRYRVAPLHLTRTQVLVVRKSGNLGGGNLPVIITSALPLVGEGEIWVVKIYQSHPSVEEGSSSLCQQWTPSCLTDTFGWKTFALKKKGRCARHSFRNETVPWSLLFFWLASWLLKGN